jgi:Flp pilus assembly protein TadD
MSRSAWAALALLASSAFAETNDYVTAWQKARSAIDAGTLAKDPTEQKRSFSEAVESARAAVQLNPDGAKGHAYLAVALGKLALFHGGRTKVELSKEVKLEAEKTLALDPNDDLGHHVLGVWNREMVELNWFLRKFAELLYGAFPSASMNDALKHLRRATELAPTVLPHRVELGLTLIAAGQTDAARQTLEKAVAMPETWVTDEIYRQKAKDALKRISTRSARSPADS